MRGLESTSHSPFLSFSFVECICLKHYIYIYTLYLHLHIYIQCICHKILLHIHMLVKIETIDLVKFFLFKNKIKPVPRDLKRLKIKPKYFSKKRVTFDLNQVDSTFSVHNLYIHFLLTRCLSN